MYRIIVLSCSFLYSICSTAQMLTEIPATKDISSFGLKGDVQKVYTMQYAIRLQERTLVDGTIFTDTVLLKSKETKLEFNESGYLLSQQVDSFDDQGKAEYNKETLYYYINQNLVSVAQYEKGKLTDSLYIGYNRKGLIDEQIFYDKKQKKQGRAQYFYRNGKIFNIKLRDDKDMLVNFLRFEYDEHGNMTEQEIKGNTLQYISSVKYSYDTLDNGSRQINKYDYVGEYKFMGLEGHTVDANGRLVEVSIMDSNKRMTRHATMEYNIHGLLSSELIFTMYKLDYTYAYEYDNHGNWKTKRKYEQGLPVSKTHRVIDFYKREEVN